MGYFDTIKKAQIGEKTIMDNHARQQTENAFKKIKPQLDDALIQATKEGVKTGAAAMYDDINKSLLMRRPGGNSMGIHPAVAQKMGAEALRSKAISVVDQLDAAQEQGAPPQELAKVFNSLDPNLKQAVQAVKLEKEKLKQQELDGINQVADLQQNQMLVPGSAVDRVNSPITKQIVPGILQETMSIGKQ